MVKIVVRGAGADEIEAGLRVALRGVEGDWTVVAVRLVTSWAVGFPVSPGNVFQDTSWVGPGQQVAPTVRTLLEEYGLAPRGPAPGVLVA
jgi:hypothetical protein